MKGVKSLHCLDINNSTELLELHYDDLIDTMNQIKLKSEMEINFVKHYWL